MHDVPYFDRFAPLYDLVLPGTDLAPLEAGLALSEREVQCVLDLGGGTGRAARVLPSDSLVLDGSHPMLFRAREYDLDTVRGDVRTLPLRDEIVDGVVVVDAAHHFPTVSRAIEEAVRVLRPGGTVVIREFDPSTIRGRGLVFGEHLIGFESMFFTPDEMVKMLREAGLSTHVQERGFVYTVAGVKPGNDDAAGTAAGEGA